MASRVRVRVLNSVDLPTLGRPTSATIGSTDVTCPRPWRCARAIGRRAERVDDAAIIQQQQQAIGIHRRVGVAHLARADAADEGTGAAVQPVHVALVVRDHDRIAGHGRT